MPWVVLCFALILVTLSVSSSPHALAQDKPWRIGFLSGGLPQVPDKPGDLAAFRQGLDGLGYQEGDSVHGDGGNSGQAGGGHRAGELGWICESHQQA